ncbi:MAG TPA: YggS family pyridoxal phosphate-dependent enzyme [Methylotenera sp.]|nr:YggS family pyridoxal phosphate-dependent enzyme [Methylotenera sp.]
MTSINSQLQEIHTRIQSVRAENGCPQPVYVLAVSKSKPAAAVREAYIAGQTMFGENYLQEALEKQAQLTDLPIEWHFIGPIQSNKTQAIAQHFSWVHSVDRLKIAQRLNDARPIDLPPLQICIQVNISHEESKSGVQPEALCALASEISHLPQLRLRGLMAIPAPTPDIEAQREQFKQVRRCYEALIAKGFDLDTLSIGMSDDYPIAIEQGATIVRIGAAIFGARQLQST